jgi:hypothetical protein
MDGFTVKGVPYEWTGWVDLETALIGSVLPSGAGLYRIRRVGDEGLDYIGQTGVGISARVRMLLGITREVMPYRDPHTAGPALWALLHSTRCAFEVSGLPIAGDATWRKGLEAVAIGLYRQEAGRSPTVNFGRMPAGFRMSSGNNAKLVAAGKRFRGGIASEPDASHLPGLSPLDGLGGDPHGFNWCGHDWSEWSALAEYPSRRALASTASGHPAVTASCTSAKVHSQRDSVHISARAGRLAGLERRRSSRLLTPATPSFRTPRAGGRSISDSNSRQT